jgi:hypothetical protein
MMLFFMLHERLCPPSIEQSIAEVAFVDLHVTSALFPLWRVNHGVGGDRVSYVLRRHEPNDSSAKAGRLSS